MLKDGQRTAIAPVHDDIVTGLPTSVPSPDGNAPLVSVLMPVFNVDRYLGRAIESILNQVYPNLELVIHLDASTDDSVAIAERYADGDDRIVLVGSGEDVGLSIGLNKAAAVARGSFLARMDADDIARPQRLATQVEFLTSHPAVVVVGSDALHINEADEVLGLTIAGPRSVDDFERMRSRGEITLVLDGTSMMRRETFERVGGYDPELPIALEVDLHSRMAEYGAIVALSEPLLLYRLRPGSRVATRFYEGRGMHRFVATRDDAIREGHTPPSYPEFLASEASAPWWRRLKIRLTDSGRFHYRMVGLHLASGEKGAAVMSLGRAFVTNPGFVVRRTWQRRMSPAARRTLREVGVGSKVRVK
jgi:glycosyltransferase involved in cell wall biosynthesis